MNDLLAVLLPSLEVGEEILGGDGAWRNRREDRVEVGWWT